MSEYRKTVSLDQLQEMFAKLGAKVPAAMRAAMNASVWSMIRDVVANRLSGQYLRVRTGTARRSMHGHVEDSGESVRGYIGNPHEYVRAHEMGYQGPVQVRAHTRQLARLERNRGGKVTKRSAAAYKKRLRKGYAMTAHVRAHTRQVNIRARRFIRDTLDLEAMPYSATRAAGRGSRLDRRVIRALEILLDSGRVPKTGELRG